MDKNKIIEAAAKLVAKGAYDKAIKEYQKILDADPKDVRILQKMGELYQKKNDNAQAAVFFTKVAESYTNDGFFLKAVALYKQVLKLDPSLLEINVKLAELHQQLQLLGEAMAYYQIVANHYDTAGDTRKSLEVLKKMVELDPDNVASRVKLADLFVREGLNPEAVVEFTRAADHLKRNNRVDDYLRVAERLSGLEPDNLTLARELAELYLQRNDQKRALAKLQICFKADNRDIDTLRLLGVAFQGLGQTSKTISVYKELARAYGEKGLNAEAEQVWAQVAQLDPHDGDVAARAAPVATPEPAVLVATAEVAAYIPAAARRPPEPRPASPVPQPHPQATVVAGAHVASRPKPDNIAKLLTETDVYVKYGLHDKALEHLRKVFGMEPENIDAHEKAYAIYVASNNHAQAFEQLLNVLRLHTRAADAERAQPYLATILEQNPNHPEVPIFMQALQVGQHQAPQAEHDDRLNDDAILVDSSDDEVIVADESSDEVISAEVAEDGLELPEVLSDDLTLAAEDEWAAAPAEAEPPVAPSSWGATDQPWADEPAPLAPFEAPSESEPDTGEYALAEPQGEDAAGVALGDEQLQDAPTRMVARLDPSSMKTSSGLRSMVQREVVDEELDDTPLPAAVDEEYQTNSTPIPADEVLEEAVEAPPEDEPAGEEVDEATFFIEQGLYDEAREILETVLIAYPEHQRAAQLLASVDAAQSGGATTGKLEAHSPPTGERDAFNLAAELANELGELEQQSPEPASSGSDDYQVSVDEVFAEFKKGLEKVVKPEDVDTHYDLGVAYKEMGLLDDAVSEFTIARKGCIGKRKEVDCLSMIGMLEVIKGDFAGAVDAFMQALASEHSRDEVEKSLRFDLGGAYEAGGQLGRALAQYLRVQRLDPHFREVHDHVERLSALVSPEEDAPTPRASNKRKVGFV